MSDSKFWNEEAKALGVGITLYVATDPSEEGQRNLGRVRDIITSGKSEFDEVLNRMLANENPVVRSTALRTATKDPKLLSNVLASLQAHTHWLESPRIRQNLSRSDFRFEDLKKKKITVYLVLPADRLKTFAPWLRLLVQIGITVNARNIEDKPDKPILFLIDEASAALGSLPMLRQAVALMAGFGLHIWTIFQDIGQIEHTFGKGWETFISNSGVLQYYGSRDLKTAEYFSKLAGVTTVEKLSWTQGISRMIGSSHTSGVNAGSSLSSGPGGMSHSTTHGSSSSTSSSVSNTDSESESRDVVQRPLIMPDELMVMRRDEALLLVENLNPIKGFRIKWFDHEILKRLGSHLRTKIAQARQEKR